MKRASKIKISVMILIIFILGFSTAWADERFTTLEKHNYKVKNTYQISNSGKYDAFDINISILIGTDSDSAYQSMRSYRGTPAFQIVRRDALGNIYGEITLSKLKPGEHKTITIERDIENCGVLYDKSIDKINADYSDFLKVSSNMKYLQPEKMVESNKPEILQKAATFDKNKNVTARARDIYDFVNLYITYNDSEIYSNKGALSAYKTAQGVCYEYATLFTALCRGQGIPARVVTGYWQNENIPKNTWKDISGDGHAWAEFYLPDAGWVPVEPTFIYTLDGVRTPNHDYFAAIPETSKHIIIGYGTNNVNSDIRVHYSYYNKTQIDIESTGQKLMRLDETSAFGQPSLSDISATWAKDYIARLYNRGILFAKSENQYKPQDNITRSEFAAFLINAVKVDQNTATALFGDVEKNNIFIKAITAASDMGLIKGNAGKFYPDMPITREDAAVIMARALTQLDIKQTVEAPLVFADKNSISKYALESVAQIYSVEIMTGKPNNLFAPRDFLSRAETAKMIDNFLKVIK